MYKKHTLVKALLLGTMALPLDGFAADRAALASADSAASPAFKQVKLVLLSDALAASATGKTQVNALFESCAQGDVEGLKDKIRLSLVEMQSRYKAQGVSAEAQQKIGQETAAFYLFSQTTLEYAMAYRGQLDDLTAQIAQKKREIENEKTPGPRSSFAGSSSLPVPAPAPAATVAATTELAPAATVAAAVAPAPAATELAPADEFAMPSLSPSPTSTVSEMVAMEDAPPQKTVAELSKELGALEKREADLKLLWGNLCAPYYNYVFGTTYVSSLLRKAYRYSQLGAALRSSIDDTLITQSITPSLQAGAIQVLQQLVNLGGFEDDFAKYLVSGKGPEEAGGIATAEPLPETASAAVASPAPLAAGSEAGAGSSGGDETSRPAESLGLLVPVSPPMASMLPPVALPIGAESLADGRTALQEREAVTAVGTQTSPAAPAASAAPAAVAELSASAVPSSSGLESADVSAVVEGTGAASQGTTQVVRRCPPPPPPRGEAYQRLMEGRRQSISDGAKAAPSAPAITVAALDAVTGELPVPLSVEATEDPSYGSDDEGGDKKKNPPGGTDSSRQSRISKADGNELSLQGGVLLPLSPPSSGDASSGAASPETGGGSALCHGADASSADAPLEIHQAGDIRGAAADAASFTVAAVLAAAMKDFWSANGLLQQVISCAHDTLEESAEGAVRDQDWVPEGVEEDQETVGALTSLSRMNLGDAALPSSAQANDPAVTPAMGLNDVLALAMPQGISNAVVARVETVAPPATAQMDAAPSNRSGKRKRLTKSERKNNWRAGRRK